MKSVGAQLEELWELLKKRDLPEWEHNFITDLYEKYLARGESTLSFSDKQVDKIEQLYVRRIG